MYIEVSVFLSFFCVAVFLRYSTEAAFRKKDSFQVKLKRVI